MFIRNFIDNYETKNIQGLRNILWLNEYAMRLDGHPEFAPCSKVSPKFMTALLGPYKNTMYLMRGFRQYGQPLEETIEGFVEVLYVY